MQTSAERVRAKAEELLNASAGSIGASVSDDDIGFSAEDLPLVVIKAPVQQRGAGDYINHAGWDNKIELHILTCGTRASSRLQADAIHCAAHDVLMDDNQFASVDVWSVEPLGYEQNDEVSGDVTYQRRVAVYQFQSLLPAGKI